MAEEEGNIISENLRANGEDTAPAIGMLSQYIKDLSVENPNAPQPYVTWQCRTDTPNHFFWGHYFSEKEKAYRDYEERIQQEAERIEQKKKQAQFER